MARKPKVTSKRGTEKSPRFSSSEKADKLAQMILDAQSKRDRLKTLESRRTNKGLPKVEEEEPKKGKKIKSKFDPIDMIDGDLPKKERDIVKALVEGQDDDAEEDIKSLFENAFGTLQETASDPNADFRTDEAAKNMQRAAYALVLSMIPVAEVNYRVSRKQTDAYALNAFIDQARELASELRMMSDADNQSSFISKRIITPLMLSAGQILLTEMAGLKQIVDTEVKDHHASKIVKRAMDDASLSFGKFLAEMQMAFATQIGAYLQGDVTAFNVPSIMKPQRKKKRRE